MTGAFFFLGKPRGTPSGPSLQLPSGFPRVRRGRGPLSGPLRDGVSWSVSGDPRLFATVFHKQLRLWHALGRYLLIPIGWVFPFNGKSLAVRFANQSVWAESGL